MDSLAPSPPPPLFPLPLVTLFPCTSAALPLLVPFEKSFFLFTNKMQITIKLPKLGWVESKLHIKKKNTISYFSICLYQTWKKWPKKFSLDKSEMIPQWMHAIKFLTLVIWSNSSPPSQDSSAMSSRYNKRNQHQMIIQNKEKPERHNIEQRVHKEHQ